MADNDYEYEMKGIQSSSILNNRWRVKLYELNSIGHWDDLGTGHVCIQKEV
jgi:hypothetical protein